MSADFAASIGTGDFDVVIYSERNVGIPQANVTALTQWVDAGNSAILSTWSPNVVINQLFETSSVGVNFTSATFTDEIVGLFLNEVPVSDTGWVTYSRQLQPIGSAYTACSWANNTSCAVVGNGGKTINLGILVDSLSLYHTEILVPNLIRQIL
ncbi:MAG: hypothetical protein ABJ000_08440 [Saccharospirillum sp.]|uniref:hypothetical protein n=1 Tax=Saccharospirillum sp. TaxID=2033801 RepID=UPI00329A1EE2